MLHITIISLGKLKEEYWRDAQVEYLKRLSAFAKMEIVELKEEKFDDKDNPELIKQKEAEKILKVIPKNSLVISLDKEGKQFSSEQLAEKLNNESALGGNNITIVIGGPLGLSNSILTRSEESWSLSELTFTHQMVRVILLEQLYRGFMIKEGRSYHY
jgi:23S rRNA (pseudouridine1915-N3)-methyltransferase